MKKLTGTHLWTEISYRKLPRTALDNGENRPMKAGTESMMWLPEQFRFSKCFQRNKQKLQVFFLMRVDGFYNF